IFTFKCNINYVILSPGEIIKIDYRIKNSNREYWVCEASYNVTPFIASKYFNKLQCFCFNKIIIPPNANIILPLIFFIDPAICFDENTKDLDQLTLTYIMNSINI
ncbi:MAG: cytochrome c oxidase assembly protein, partial [Candidatus Hodgkinia cicadicola]